MKIWIDVEEDARIVASAECDAAADETVEVVVSRVAGQLQIEGEEVLLDLFDGEERIGPQVKMGERGHGGNRLRHRRSCVDLHFESEAAMHRFPASATWARVHQWGCKHFRVPHDACVNLELRKGAPDGPALNEAKEIGLHRGCEVVWLVKPGPEPNGCHNG